MTGRDQELAKQLVGLKERSGLSYGQLSTRLHLSTSTLHRYCNGTAIPAEFATLERFARTCGAEREELITLHRTWLLADAVRRADATTEPPPADALHPPAARPADVDELAPAARRRRRWVAPIVAAVALAVMSAVVAWAVLDHSGHPAPQATPAPLSVNVLSDNWDSACGDWFYATKPPSAVPPPPGLPDVALWAAPLHAVPGSHLRLQVTLQGAAGQPPVVLHTAYVRIVSTGPAPAGYGYTMGSGCGGGLDPTSFALDLNADSPHLRTVRGVGDSPATAVDFPFQVSASGPQVINLDAATPDRDVTWYLELVWSSGSQQGTLRVDDHGKPFHTIGLAHDPLYFYNGHRWSPYR